MLAHFPSLTSLRAFEAAARRRSFKLAAEELSVTATAISHRIRVLEEYLERPLFLRKVRAVELTLAGQILFAAVSDGFQGIAAAVEQVRKPQQASVTLSATPAFVTKWLVPRLADFQATQPGIDLHIHASNSPVDLNNGTVDLAIRYGPGPYAGVWATRLLDDRFVPVASPALLDRVSEDAAQWPLIHFDWQHPPSIDLTWAAWARESGRPLPLSSGIRYSEESHAIQAAVSGQGVALLSLLLVEEELRLGLLRIASPPILKGLAYHLLKPRRRLPGAAVLVVENWLMQAAVEHAAKA